MRHTRHRKDGNHDDVARTLRDHLIPFIDCHNTNLGADFLARHRNGYLVLLEVKDPKLPPSRRTLTARETDVSRAFGASAWRLVMTEADVLEAVGLAVRRSP